MAIKIRQNQLRRILKSQRLSKSEWAKKLGITRVWLYILQHDDPPVGTKLIEALLTRTGYTFDELFYFDGKEDRK